MRKTTPSANAYSKPTRIFDGNHYGTDSDTRSSGSPFCKIYQFEKYLDPKPSAPPKYTSIKDLVNKWEKDSTRRAALSDARRWVAEEFYGEDGETLKSLRLKKGLSQTHVAEMMSTSQSHIARIERGTENVAIQTCRRLCRALDVDMNTLDRALRQQEKFAHSKPK